MAYSVKLDDVLKEHGLTRDQLDSPCSPEVSKALALKLDNWKLLASFVGLNERDCVVIEENNRDYETQSVALMSRWRKQLGNKATYLMLAKGLEKIKQLSLVGELCVLYLEYVMKSQDEGSDHFLNTSSLDFETRFRDLVIATQEELEKISMKAFRTDITLLPSTIKHNHLTFLKENISNLKKASDIEEIFMHLNLYWNYFNYTLLEAIIKRNGSKHLKQQMKSYASDMHQFWRKTTVADFIPYCKSMQRFETIPEEFTKLKIKESMEKPLSEYTLMELDQLKRRFIQSCQLPDFALILYELQEGSLEVTWLVATELREQLQRMLSGQPEIGTLKILSGTIRDNMIVSWMYYSHRSSSPYYWKTDIENFLIFICDCEHKVPGYLNVRRKTAK